MVKHNAQEIPSPLTLVNAAAKPMAHLALSNVRMNKPRRTVKRDSLLPSVVKTTTEPGSVSVSNARTDGGKELCSRLFSLSYKF